MSYRSCQTCVEADRPGYCASLRCYCGHEACEAFASYIDTSKQQAPTGAAAPTQNKHHAKSWAEREEETWLERL